MGKQRGGPAKVAIFSSGLMGSMSGSVVTNVMTTGQLTIPAMKNSGMRAEAAGAVEAVRRREGVASTDNGSTAFVMASFWISPTHRLLLPHFYLQCSIFSLYVQIDSYAGARFKGIDEDKIPQLISVLRSGWHYLGAFGLLIFLLLVLQQEAVAPYSPPWH